MSDSITQDEILVDEHSVLEKRGNLSWAHWIVIISSFLLTIFTWRFSESQVDQKLQVQFDVESNRILELVVERMRKYEDALWAGVAVFRSQNEVSLEEWKVYTESIQIETKYTGINGLGYIEYLKPDEVEEFLKLQRTKRPDFKIHPQHNESEFFPIKFIDPFENNKQAVGLDIAHEQNRFTAAKKSRDTGTSQITGPIVLVQDDAKTPGFLFYAPYYKDGTFETVEKRRDNFEGLVYAPFIVNKLLEGTLRREIRHISMKITDEDSVLFNENTEGTEDFDSSPLFQSTKAVKMYGRNWKFDFQSAKSFRETYANNQPVTILLSGLIINGLVIGLFLVLSNTTRRALKIANEKANALTQKTVELERSNKQLGDFTYVASHDLKSPLRSIKHRAMWAIEDSEGQMPEQSSAHLSSLIENIARMENLLSDLLEYSRIGRRQDQSEFVDVKELITEVVKFLSPPEEFTVNIGSMPVIYTETTPLKQVFRNIIENAIKYSDKNGKGRISLTSSEQNGTYNFWLKDDGPGIPKKLQHKIFQIFQRLHSKSEIPGTGIGLAMVKKIVEENGGKIEVESDEGEGTTFHFSWIESKKQSDT